MNRKNFLRLLAVTVLLLIFLFSGWKVLSILNGYHESRNSYQELTQEYITQQTFELENRPQDTSFSDAVLEAEPLETAPISVDFPALQAEYPDIVGWLYCPDTPIHYPIVHGKDNLFYVDRLPDGTPGLGGSIFLDCRCTADFSGWNSILYGHNMKNDTMFGTLQNYKEQAYYAAHPTLYLLTPNQDYKVVLIAGYTTSGTDEDTYGIPSSCEERNILIEKARQETTFDTYIEITDTDRLMTLSTCAYDYDGARYILVGILEKLASLP